MAGTSMRRRLGTLEHFFRLCLSRGQVAKAFMPGSLLLGNPIQNFAPSSPSLASWERTKGSGRGASSPGFLMAQGMMGGVEQPNT
jgi:hypothetical protein